MVKAIEVAAVCALAAVVVALPTPSKACSGFFSFECDVRAAIERTARDAGRAVGQAVQDTAKSVTLAPASGGVQVLATRTFVGPQNFPPANYPAYGIVVFPDLATASSRDRYITVCQAYWAALVAAQLSSVPPEKQMVTVWPVHTQKLATQISGQLMVPGCETAVDEYDLGTALVAIKQAGDPAKLKGHGPFLLAWSPAFSKGSDGVPVLFLDLSGAATGQQFLDYFNKWRDDIQQNPDLWIKPTGWSLDAVRLRFQEFADATGGQIISFLTGSK